MSKLSEALKRVERSNRSFLPFFKFPVGKTDLRILPAAKMDGDEDWFLAVGLHYNLNEKQPIVCRMETNWNNEHCPVCAAVAELRAAGQNDEAQRIGLRKQYLVRAIIRGQEDKGAQIVRLPTTVFQDVGKIIQEAETFGDVLNMSPKGRDIRVIKTGSGLNTAYSVQALPKTQPALPTQPEAKAVYDKLTSIFTLANIPTEDEVEAVVQAKLGFSVKGGGSLGDSADDEAWGGAEEKGDSDSDWDDSKDEGKDDWGDEGDDVPFDDSKSAESGVVVKPASDDSWLDDTAEDEQVDFDFTARMKEKQEKTRAQVSGLTEGLNKALEKHTTEPERKRGKSRSRVGA